MAKIKNVKGRQVFDSRGNPTVEAEVYLDNGISSTAISPSGASTGAFEAHELRDKDQNKFSLELSNIEADNPDFASVAREGKDSSGKLSKTATNMLLGDAAEPVSYTHLTLPTKRIV